MIHTAHPRLFPGDEIRRPRGRHDTNKETEYE